MMNEHLALDVAIQTNPAFALAGLRWVCEGYEDLAGNRESDSKHLLPVWGMAALALIAPSAVRGELPQTAGAKLALLMARNVHWRAGMADAIRGWSTPFWHALRLGVATGTLSLERGRVVVRGGIQVPTSRTALDLRKRSRVLGKLLAKEGSDSSIALVLGVSVTR